MCFKSERLIISLRVQDENWIILVGESQTRPNHRPVCFGAKCDEKSRFLEKIIVCKKVQRWRKGMAKYKDWTTREFSQHSITYIPYIHCNEGDFEAMTSNVIGRTYRAYCNNASLYRFTSRACQDETWKSVRLHWKQKQESLWAMRLETMAFDPPSPFLPPNVPGNEEFMVAFRVPKMPWQGQERTSNYSKMASHHHHPCAF